ncbi:MAG: shikimate dehydrogenase [Frankiaceae bacterium]
MSSTERLPVVRAAVLGSPIAHSLSPVLHRAAYAELGLDWAYDVIECDVAALPAALGALATAPPPAYAGASLTMPLKLAAWRLVDVRAPSAEVVGAVNAVLFEDGRLVGHNTDVAGLVAAIGETGRAGAPDRAAVLGGGGAARAAVAALARLGAAEVTVVVRAPARAASLAEMGERLGIRVEVASWAGAAAAIGGAPLVVAATPPGAADGLAAAGWPPGTALVDVCYAPWPTALAAAAAAAGAPVVGGLAMLVGQAAEAVELMTGRPAPVAAMRAAGEAALAALAAREA